MIGLDQPITLWERTTDVTGGPSFSTPEVIYGRWEDRQETFVDSKSVTVQSKAVIYLESAEPSPGSWVARGDQTAYANPKLATGAFEVKQFSKIPDLRYVKYERKAYC